MGVAVHPKDGRYESLVGRKALLPIINREIVIVADEAIDPEFGTGALKVTPGHDPVDFEIGQRHGLPVINSIALDATMTEEAGPYRGMDRFECRRAIVRDLEEGGFLVKTEPYTHSIGHCQRCDTVIEPLISPQWFLKMAPLAAPAIEAVTSGRLRFVPERFTRVYLNWMENIRDWCISRQLWFGHGIPVWYCDDCGGQMASVEDPSRCRHCGSARLRQDSDVLDTWFSSALWPHSTLGWPDETEDLAYFYPTSVMETGYDIIFFWVARMVMMGLYNMKEIPFHTVYLHGLVRDERGEKISKSKVGRTQTVSAAIEDVVGTYGTDALRYTLATGGSPGNDMNISEQKLEAGRNFANKLWNAARFVLTNLDGARLERPSLDRRQAMPLEDRWIMSRLQRVTASVSQLLERFELGEAGRQVHDFLWGEYCDWYVEMAKVRLRAGDSSPLPVLVHVLDSSLRLLHPYMPYVTEEILAGPGRPPAGPGRRGPHRGALPAARPGLARRRGGGPGRGRHRGGAGDPQHPLRATGGAGPLRGGPRPGPAPAARPGGQPSPHRRAGPRRAPAHCRRGDATAKRERGDRRPGRRPGGPSPGRALRPGGGAQPPLPPDRRAGG